MPIARAPSLAVWYSAALPTAPKPMTMMSADVVILKVLCYRKARGHLPLTPAIRRHCPSAADQQRQARAGDEVRHVDSPPVTKHLVGRPIERRTPQEIRGVLQLADGRLATRLAG
jgi:hypothetical protein